MREIHQGLVLVLAVTLPTLASCASSTAGEPSPSELPTVELVIHNETERAVTAYLQWVGSRATRLGVIPFQASRGIPVERGQRMDVIVGPRGTCYLQHDPDC
jgi:hypothetical protein